MTFHLSDLFKDNVSSKYFMLLGCTCHAITIEFKIIVCTTIGILINIGNVEEVVLTVTYIVLINL